MMQKEDGRIVRAQLRQAATNAELLRAAATVFTAKGYHATRVSDIAEEAGVGQGTFYRHFVDKRAVLDSVTTQMLNRLAEVFEAENAPENIDNLNEYVERASDIGTKVFDLMAAEREAFGFLLRELPSVDDRAVAGIDAMGAMMRGVIEGYYRRGIAMGYFRADLDVSSSATAVVGLGIAAWWTIVHSPDDTDFRHNYRETVIDFIVRHAISEDHFGL